MYVIAHEWGHHIQNLTGAIDASQSGATGAASGSVRVELQADCYAGAWVAAASEQPTAASDVPLLEPVTQAQIADALNAAASIGDDRIQESSGGAGEPRGVDARLQRAAPDAGSRPATTAALQPATPSRSPTRSSERRLRFRSRFTRIAEERWVASRRGHDPR